MIAPMDPNLERQGMPELIVKRVSKTFPGQKALDDVSITMRSGEVHCILGQNGCGKSTLIKILSGYHAPDDGSQIHVGETPLTPGKPLESDRLGLRFVHQQNGVIGELTALENLALGAGYRRTRSGRIDWDQQRAAARDLLSLVGRPDLDLDLPMSAARAVDRTAVAIARALDPSRGEIRYLFLDEPTAALPVSEVDHLMALVSQVKARGVGVVYVTHRLDEVFRIADTVTVLRDGLHICTMPVDELTSAQLIDLIVGERSPDTHESRPTPKRSPAPQHSEPKVPRLRVRGLRSELVKNVDLEVYAGEILGIAGLDGSGREELVYGLIGAIPSEFSDLTVGDAIVSRHLTPQLAKRHGIALAPGNRQPGSAVQEFTIKENITLPQLSVYRRGVLVSQRQERRDVTTWLDRLSVRSSSASDPTGAPFSELSGGNQQKIVLAKWLATNPQILLLDEPSSGVDVGAREAIYDVIRDQSERGVGVVLSSSDVQDHLAICDRVLVLRGGSIAAELTGAEITEASLLDTLMGSEASYV